MTDSKEQRKPVTKDAQIHIRVRRSEHQTAKLLAAREGVSLSEYLIGLIKADAEKKGVPI